MSTIEIIEKLYKNNDATREELLYLLDNIDEKSKELLIHRAQLSGWLNGGKPKRLFL